MDKDTSILVRLGRGSALCCFSFLQLRGWWIGVGGGRLGVSACIALSATLRLLIFASETAHCVSEISVRLID